MKKLITISVVAIVLAALTSTAQNFTYRYGVMNSDEGFDVKALANGECVVVGHYSARVGSSSQCMLVLRLNANGTAKWSKTLCNTDMSRATNVFVLQDSSIIISGYTRRDMGDFERKGALVKLNSNGDTVWFRKYDTSTTGVGQILFDAMAIAENGDFVVGGNNIIARINGSGDVVWAAEIGSDDLDLSIYHIIVAADSSIIACGSVSDTSLNLAVVKISGNGNFEWMKSYGIAPDYEGANGLIELPNGELFVVGQTGFGYQGGLGLNDMILMKLDANGDTLFTKLIGGSGVDVGNKIIKHGSNYVISGYSSTGVTGGSKLMVLTIDDTGNILSTRLSGPVNAVQGRGIDISGNHLFTAGAILLSDADLYVAKTDLDGTAACDNENTTLSTAATAFNVRTITSSTRPISLVARGESTITVGSMNVGTNLCGGSTGLRDSKMPDNQLAVYPNPNNGKFVISGTESAHYAIMDLQGKTLMEIQVDNTPVEIDTGLRAGVYVLYNKQSGQCTKLIIQ